LRAVKPNPPFIPGHEGVGIVVQTGPGVKRLSEGMRVAVPWLGWACGTCEACLAGWETLCATQVNTGYGVDGCHAEYVRASADFVGIVPDSITSIDAAPLTCAGVTTYKAVKVSGARSSDLVAVFGIGGLGHMAVQYARIAGASAPPSTSPKTSWSRPRNSVPNTSSTPARPRPTRRSVPSVVPIAPS
jgi:alcohol dehydrogenase, propanol-preferring